MKTSVIALSIFSLLAEGSPSFEQESKINPGIGTSTEENEDVRSIRRLIEQQQKDWNRGDIESFMEGYERSDSLLFTSRAQVHRGWLATLKRYKESYPNRDAMGRLDFSDLEITLLGTSGAVVLGKWALTRSKDSPHGIFTLVFRKGPGGWKIIHDHTSSFP